MTLTPARIFYLLLAVAGVAVLATLLTIGAVASYAASRPTATVRRAPAYIAPYQPPANTLPFQQQRDIDDAKKAACDAQKRAYEAQVQSYEAAKASGKSDPFLFRPMAPIC